MATDIQKLIVAIETVGAEETQKQLNKLKNTANQTEKATGNLGKQASKTNQFFGKMRGSTSALTNTTGQLSVQLQDVGVQFQQGTDATRIFAQQGPQIASIFGPSGAVVGALIAFSAIIAGPIIKSLLNAGVAIDETIDRIRNFEDALSDLNEAERQLKLALIAQDMREVEKRIRDLTEAQKDSIDRFNELRANGASFSSAIFEIASGFASLDEAQRDSTIQLLASNAAVQEARDEYAELSKQADILTGKTKEVDEATETQKDNLKEYLLSLEEQFATLGMNTVQLGIYKAMQMGASISDIKATRAILEKIVAYEEAEEAAKEAAIAAERAADEEARQQERRERQAESFRQRLNKARFQAIVDAKAEADALQKEQEEAELERIKEQNQRVFEEQKRHMEQVFAEYEKKEEDRKRIQATTTNALLAFEDRLLEGKSEKQKAAYRLAVNLADAEKRENAKQIVSDSYSAAMKAYKALAGIPIIGPALGAAAAGVILAAGVSYAGKSLAGRALGGQVREGESYVVGERGPEVLTMGSSGRVIPNEAMRGGQQQVVNKNANITFEISTVDARGFDQLLQSRRGQIINMVNTAMNDQGRRGVA